MLKELIEFEEKHYLTVIVSVLAIICPGFLTVYMYHPELVASLDIFKLLILSAAIGLPLVVCNSYFVLLATDKLKQTPFALIWTFGASITVCIYYTTLLISYYFKLPFRYYTYIILAFEGVDFLLSVLVGWAKERKTPSNKPINQTA